MQSAQLRQRAEALARSEGVRLTLRTRALEGHKRARGRPHEHDVGVFGFLQGRVGDRGLTGALPARELGDIVAQLARSLAADAAVSDYADTDVRENFAQA